MSSPRTIARTAGILYLSMSVVFIAGNYVRGRVYEAGDATAIADGIRSSAALFRVAVGLDLLTVIVYLATAMALYVLLRRFNQLAAAAMVVLVAVITGIGYADTVNQYAALTVVTDNGYVNQYGRAASNALVRLLTDSPGDAHANSLFFGLWLLPLGYLAIKSGYFPKVVGALLLIAGVDWVARFFTYFFIPGLSALDQYFAVGAIGEFAFTAWLLFGPIRIQDSNAATPANGPGLAGMSA